MLYIFSQYSRFAEAHNCTELANEALEHVQTHWNVVALGDELLDLPLAQLNVFLSSEQLKVDSEEQVSYCIFLLDIKTSKLLNKY